MKLRVLLVEDNPGDALLIKGMLRVTGAFQFEVQHVDRLATALEVLGSSGADAVLLDLGLPDSQGQKTAETVQLKFPGLPLIILTGNEDEELASRLVRDGIQDYLVKGDFSQSLLVRAIRHAFERKTAEEKLKDSEATLLASQKVARMGSWSLDLTVSEGEGLLRWSEEVYRIMGYEPGRVEPSVDNYLQRVHPDDRDALVERLTKATTEGTTYQTEHRIIGADGVERFVTAQGDVFRDYQSGKPVRMVGILQDITEKKRAIEYLRRSEERYRLLSENANDLIYSVDCEANLLSANKAFEKATGYQRDEILGKSIVNLVPPDQVEEAREQWRRQMAGESRMQYRMDFITKDQRRINLEISSQPIFENNVLVGFQRIARDATERLSLEHQLRQSQKMEAVGRLAGGIAHDFNNLLGVIIGYSELQLAEPDLSEVLSKRLEQIFKAGQSAAALTRQLLAFSRKQLISPQVLDLNAVVTRSESLLKRLIGEDIEFGSTLASGLAKIKADATQLEQIIMNLVVNARDAMPTGGKLTIATGEAVIDEAFCRQFPFLLPGAYVVLSISDTGCGMDKDTQAHIFEPFFTTKEQGKGTGLGLATVYGAVKQSGGYILLDSHVGVGTSFHIYWPHIDQALTLPQSETPAMVLSRPSAVILLVEDADALRTLTMELLKSTGYTVIAASDGADALQKAESCGALDLLLTDVIMPGMSGPELARQLSASQPGLRVLFMSGYTDDLLMQHQLTGFRDNLIEKPFTRDALRSKVDRALRDQRAAAAGV